MMCRITFVIQLAAFAAYAGPPLQNYSSPFDAKGCEVVWDAPTNYPASVIIYSVVPTKFSSETISNLLEVAKLTVKNKRRPTHDGVLGGKDVLIFSNKEDSRHLDIIPSQGTIGLVIDGTTARIPKELPVGVPSAGECLNLATNLLQRLGYRQADLVPKSGGEFAPGISQASVLHKDKSSGLIVTNIISREIFLHRQLDGIPVTGHAGVTMKFGNEAKLADLSIVWRTVQPGKTCPVPTPGEFVALIRSNRAMIYVEHADKPYKKMTIKKASIFYWESEGSQFQKRIFPFAVLDAETDLMGENSKARLFVSFADE